MRAPLRRRFRPLLCLALAFLAAGCSLGDTIGRHGIAYNGSVQTATDTVLLLNVLRARDQAPLHFTEVGAIHGSLSLSAALGYDLSNVNGGTEPALIATTSPSFDIAPLDRQEFARGLLRPIDPALLRLLSDQGWPAQLLLHLLVSRFDEGPGGRIAVNDPRRRQDLDPATRAACAREGLAARAPCDPFQAMVDAITGHGPLQFNGYTRLVPVGPRLTRAEAIAPENLTTARQPGMTMRQDGTGWQLYRALPQLVVCVPGGAGNGTPGRYTALALDNDAPQASPMSQEGSPCTADEVADRPSGAGEAATPGVSWYLRSVDEVLRYLGEVQRREEAGIPYRINIGAAGTPRLFRLWSERPTRPRLSAEYQGRPWWVAEYDEGEDLTLRVLALTTQLLNLQKSASEIPSAGTLRLVR
ncbi:hypothetical protein D9599_12780 [Roseomonas sp. KE2513]|uniref:hypothetical protein n=1 Tax=Roseomonas sp. KE2513 TaxID=2479202 RepID=UPI0018DF006A|nr:hypothetical protein [Roseomonas sp. KE2513]MBI0536451.1 hypothetical protein [Roseomonas sp. KE2513]